MDFHPIRPAYIQWISTQFDWHTYNVISMDFHPIRPVEFDWHLKPLTGIQCNLNGFPPNSLGWCLVESVKLGGRIGWKSIEITLYTCLVESVELGGRIGSKSIEITLYACLVESVKLDIISWIFTQFNRFDQPSSQWKINTKLHNTSEVDSTSKSTGFIKYFLSLKSTFMTCPQTGRLQF